MTCRPVLLAGNDALEARYSSGVLGAHRQPPSAGSSVSPFARPSEQDPSISGGIHGGAQWRGALDGEARSLDEVAGAGSGCGEVPLRRYSSSGIGALSRSAIEECRKHDRCARRAASLVHLRTPDADVYHAGRHRGAQSHVESPMYQNAPVRARALAPSTQVGRRLACSKTAASTIRGSRVEPRRDRCATRARDGRRWTTWPSRVGRQISGAGQRLRVSLRRRTLAAARSIA